MDIGPNERLHECDGDDEQVRLGFSLDVFAERSRDSYLDLVLYYWETLGGDGRALPRVTEFQPFELFAKDPRYVATFIDVRPASPDRFIVSRHPEGPLHPVHGGMTGKRIGDFPSRIHANACMSEYQRCKSLHRPFYHEINQVVCGVGRHYGRLLLPFADETGNVDTLACIIQRDIHGMGALASPYRHPVPHPGS